MRNSNGYGSVTLIDKKAKRRKPYRVQINVGWKDNGSPIRQTIGYAETRSKGNQMLAEYHNNPYDVDVSNATWKYVYDEWLKFKINSGTGKDGINHYKSTYKKTKDIEMIPFKDITIYMYQDIINNSEVKHDGQRRIRSLYHELYEYAKMLGVQLNSDFTRFLTIEKNQKSTKHHPFTKNEIKIFFENRNPYIDIIIFMIFTGIRPNELFKITEATDDYIITGSKTEAGKDRTIPIHEKIKPIYNDIRLNKTLSELYVIFELELTKLNMIYEPKHYPYDTRHTFSTLWKLSKADDLARKRIMGHSDKDITNSVYTHLDFEFLQKEINTITID